MNSTQNGSQPRNGVTLNKLQRWKQRVCATVEPDDQKSIYDEMLLAERYTTRLTGLFVDCHRNGEKEMNIVEKDGILMIVTAWFTASS